MPDWNRALLIEHGVWPGKPERHCHIHVVPPADGSDCFGVRLISYPGSWDEPDGVRSDESRHATQRGAENMMAALKRRAQNSGFIFNNPPERRGLE